MPGNADSSPQAFEEMLKNIQSFTDGVRLPRRWLSWEGSSMAGGTWPTPDTPCSQGALALPPRCFPQSAPHTCISASSNRRAEMSWKKATEPEQADLEDGPWGVRTGTGETGRFLGRTQSSSRRVTPHAWGLRLQLVEGVLGRRKGSTIPLWECRRAMLASVQPGRVGALCAE